MQSVVLNSGPEVEALLLPSARPDVASAWHGHVSFAHWIVSVLEPRLVVELGTHNGTSFAAFCNAVRHLDLRCDCFAIDTWQGDDQAGFYSESVYTQLKRFNDSHYASFAKLLRCRFDEALERFSDGTIDLLHIDGLHTYEAVKHDFTTWLPKMSAKGVVLFHDTVVTHADFGVHKLWAELDDRYSSFNFHHSAGLGVLAVGMGARGALAQLCEAPNETAQTIRKRFEMASDAAYALGLQRLRPRLPVFAGTNIAIGCQAWQSSFLHTNSPTPQGALNGQKTGGYGFHTADEPEPWWKVDLGSVQQFETIVVFNRIDPGCEERSSSLQVHISDDDERWTTIYSHAGAAFGGADGRPLAIEGSRKARYVMVKLRERNYLHLDEVEIYQH